MVKTMKNRLLKRSLNTSGGDNRYVPNQSLALDSPFVQRCQGVGARAAYRNQTASWPTSGTCRSYNQPKCSNTRSKIGTDSLACTVDEVQMNQSSRQTWRKHLGAKKVDPWSQPNGKFQKNNQAETGGTQCTLDRSP